MHISTKVEQYLKPLSSEIDWCEENYLWLSNVTEFWNTISNLPMIIIPLVQIFLYKDYYKAVPECKNVWMFWVLLMITGLGSAYFHASLSLFGQLLDELGILWTFCAAMYFCMVEEVLPLLLRNIQIFRQVTLSFAILSTTFTFIKPELNHIFLFLFIAPASWLSYAALRLQSDSQFRQLISKAFFYWVFGVTFWILDFHFCRVWLKLKFPYLHALWHVLAAIGSYQAFVAISFCYADSVVHYRKPKLVFASLKFIGLPLVGLWHVKFSE